MNLISVFFLSGRCRPLSFIRKWIFFYIVINVLAFLSSVLIFLDFNYIILFDFFLASGAICPCFISFIRKYEYFFNLILIFVNVFSSFRFNFYSIRSKIWGLNTILFDSWYFFLSSFDLFENLGIDYNYFFNFCSASRFRLIMCIRIHESDTVYYIVSRWLRENCSIPIVDILYKVRNAKCSLVTLQIDGMWFNGEYRRKTGVSMRVSSFVFIPMKA